MDLMSHLKASDWTVQCLLPQQSVVGVVYDQCRFVGQGDVVVEEMSGIVLVEEWVWTTWHYH